MSEEKCNMVKARQQYYYYAGITGGQKVKCPICGWGTHAMCLTLHHMLPKSLGEHLWYDGKYMILLCEECHYSVHDLSIH